MCTQNYKHSVSADFIFLIQRGLALVKFFYLDGIETFKNTLFCKHFSKKHFVPILQVVLLPLSVETTGLHFFWLGMEEPWKKGRFEAASTILGLIFPRHIYYDRFATSRILHLQGF